ncbi:MAG TPA: hypothetical protein PLI47_07660 [Bacteroidia bacterium]|nr:hypothetical protein [Bacteroidia bacterium]
MNNRRKIIRLTAKSTNRLKNVVFIGSCVSKEKFALLGVLL